VSRRLVNMERRDLLNNVGITPKAISVTKKQQSNDGFKVTTSYERVFP
jgi:hypothetical protein